MKPFNLESALAGLPVLLRNGSKGYITDDARRAAQQKFNKTLTLTVNYPLTMLYERNGEVFRTLLTEKATEYSMQASELDVVGMWKEPHPLDTMPKDHPIWVRKHMTGAYKSAHFNKVDIDGHIITFGDGYTSFTNPNSLAFWMNFRFPTEEELKGTSWEGSKFVQK